MKNRSKRWALWIPLGVLALACKPDQVRSVSNVQRAATQWPAVTSATGAPHICLEYASPAAKVHDREASLVVPVGENNVEAKYSDAESLAQIYSVSEIMQFGHAALYRLCEASGNQMIEQSEYKEVFASTLKAVNGLIELQLVRQKLDAQTRLQFMREELDQIDSERCEASQHRTSVEWSRKLETLEENRAKLLRKIHKMASQSQVPERVEEVRELPSKSEWDDYSTDLKKLRECREKMRGTSENTYKSRLQSECPDAKANCEALRGHQSKYSFCVVEDTFEEVCSHAQ